MTLQIPNKIQSQVVIREVLDPCTAKATLPNGKEVYAFIGNKRALFPLVENAVMKVQLDVADFSRAEMTGE